MERLCIFCQHFRFYSGEPAYSELTPGADMVLKCAKGYWNAREFISEDDYRTEMLRARTCKDWKPVDLEAMGIKVSGNG